MTRAAVSLVTLLTVLLSGCVTSGPSDETALRAAAARAIGAPAESLLLCAGTWYRDAQGLGVLKTLTPASQVGLIVVAQGTLSFLQWNNTQGRFNVLRSVSYVDAKQAFLDKLGVGRMLVIQGPDGTFDSFEFTRGLGVVHSGSQAHQAFTVITAARSGKRQN